ncbi:MAG: hypothetical protein KA190_10170, partial [Kofleriaceae bacterium]|nr:hypothetical protein [Kofleriaceae bacterium]
AVAPAVAPAASAAARGPAGPPSGDGMFAPPAAEEEPLDLALDVAPRARAASTAPAVNAPVADALGRAPARPSRGQPVTAAAGAELEAAPAAPRAPLWRRLLGQERARMVVGAVVAVVLGFVPAHIYGVVREGGTYGTIDAELRQAQSQVQTVDDWDRLEPIRASALARKQRAQGDIATTAVLLWLLAGAGVAYVWFRTLDWSRLLAPR